MTKEATVKSGEFATPPADPRPARLLPTRAWVSLQFARARITNRLRPEALLAEVARRAFVVSPERTLKTPRSLHLGNQPDKIRRFEANTNSAVETVRINGGEVIVDAVRGYEFAQCALHRGTVLCRGRARRIRPYGEPDPQCEKTLEISDGAIAGSYLGLQYFGHWLRDDAALSELASAYGTPVSPAPPPSWSHVDDYAALLGLQWTRAENVRFDRLVLFDDEDYTPSKGERLSRLRRRIRAGTSRLATGRRVFVKRACVDSDERRFGNQEQVAEMLAAQGFAILDPLLSSVAQIADALTDAELVVGAEGSNLSHAAYFLREGGGLLAITSPDRFNTSHKRWTDLLGMRYGFLVMDPQEGGGFSADIDDLRRTVDLFDRSAARP